MTLRIRLLLAAVGIVAVSLALSGALTGILVRNLEFEHAQDQLARSALAYRTPIQRDEVGECLQYARNGSCLQARRYNLEQFRANLQADLQNLNLNGDRLILLGKIPAHPPGEPAEAPVVVFDSGGTLPLDQPLDIGNPSKKVSGDPIAERTIVLDGMQYLAAAAQLTNVTNAGFVVLARPRDRIAAQVTRDLVPLVAGAAGAALVLALVITLLLSRALTKPLGELQSAAEDIAAGNYARRVDLRGTDEIGVVGQAFNRMAEAVERSRTQQREFLANASHELKTPLTSLLGFSQALVDGSIREERDRARAATILHEEAQRVLRMSQELLDLARAESGQLALDLQPVDLGAQLQQEIELVRPRADVRRLSLWLSLPSGLPPVLADPDRLHQILENLLDNAVKYAPEGSKVAISARGADEQVETTVRNRVGRHEPDPERMFDRFYRADPSRSSAAGGAGLGLALAKSWAEVLGARLTYRPADGGTGACFRLELRVR
jgi:signal transduction histidine kinase